MTPEEYEELRSLYLQVVELDPSERKPILDAACRDRPELRRGIEDLLRNTPDQTTALGAALLGVDDHETNAESEDSAFADDLPRWFGSYKLTAKIGEGGMGTVYEAEQENPRRAVALKMIRVGGGSRTTMERFQREAQVLGRLQHRCIAQVFEAGTVKTQTGPQPFFAMELIRGKALIPYADAHDLSTRDRLALMIEIGEAVHHAHQKGVIHRDLKPDNILVDENGVPKVLDFGIAHIIDADCDATTLTTVGGQLIGTIPYMGPEQLSGGRDDVDTRSDIHSLGVILFQLLSGRLPYDLHGTPMYEAVRTVREEQPTRLGTIDTSLRGDLDAIVSKAMEKDPERRYQSALELTADLQRFLDHRPIVARPPSAMYQLSRYVQRHKGLCGASAAALLALILGIVGTSVGLWKAVQSEREAVRAQQVAQRNLALAENREQEATIANEQLTTVVEFQGSMLSDIDAETMGRHIFGNLRDRVLEELAQNGASEERLDAVKASFDVLNTTDLALQIVDEEILARAADTIEERLADQPLVEAALRQAIGETYQRLGLYTKSRPQLEKALALYRVKLGDDEVRTLDSLDSMGQLFEDMGDYPNALSYRREYVEGTRRILGTNHPNTVTAISNLSQILAFMGKNDEALSLLRESLERARRELGSDHPATLAAIDTTGRLLYSTGKYAEALPYFREVLERNRRVFGNDDKRTLTSLGSMGLVLDSMGKYAEALVYHRESLEASRRVLGNDHSYTLAAISNTAGSLWAMGKQSEALPYFHEALETSRRVLGNHHRITLVAISNLGVSLAQMGRLSEALPYLREALETSRLVFGDEHPSTLRTMDFMGRYLLRIGKPAEALPIMRETVQVSRRVLGPDHADTLWAIQGLAGVLRDLGQSEEAVTLAAEAVAGLRTALPPGHDRTGLALVVYGEILTRLGRYAEAEEALVEGHTILASQLPVTHRLRRKCAQSLVALYTTWHEADPGKGHDDKATQWQAEIPTEPDTTKPDARSSSSARTTPNTEKEGRVSPAP